MRERSRGFTLIEFLTTVFLFAILMGGAGLVFTSAIQNRQAERFLEDLGRIVNVCQRHYMRDANGDGAPDGIWPTESDLDDYLPDWSGENPWGHRVSLQVDSSGLLRITQNLPVEVARRVKRRFHFTASVSGGGGLVEVVLAVPPPPAERAMALLLKRTGDTLYSGATIYFSYGSLLDFGKLVTRRFYVNRPPSEPREGVTLEYYNADISSRLSQLQSELSAYAAQVYEEAYAEYLAMIGSKDQGEGR